MALCKYCTWFIVCCRFLSPGTDSAVNLTTSASIVSPMNLAMPRLLSLREAANSRPSHPQSFTKPQVPDVTSSGGARSTWAVTNNVTVRPQRPAGLVSKPQTLTSPWSVPANPGSSQTLRPRSSTSLAGARQLLPSTTTTTDSIPPLRIAHPQHLQAQMKQALNPSKLNVVRSTSASPLSSVTSKTSTTSGVERTDGSVAGSDSIARDAGRMSSGPALPTSKLHAAKSGAGINGDHSTMMEMKLSVAERRHSNDGIPINTLKVLTFYYLVV